MENSADEGGQRTKEDTDVVLLKAKQLESFIESSLRLRYPQIVPIQIDGQDTEVALYDLLHGPPSHTRKEWNAVEFYQAVRRAKKEPADAITHAFFDLRLQFYFLDLQGGLANRILFGPGCPDPRSPIDATTAHHYLLGLDYAQSVVVKNRILWERFMNLVHYLITGKKFDFKGSKKTKFFALCKQHHEWEWLCDYQKQMEEYDDRYRTPEVHSHSFLRALALPARETPKQPNLHDLMVPQNVVRNLWANLLALLDGKPAPIRVQIPYSSEHQEKRKDQARVKTKQHKQETPVLNEKTKPGDVQAKSADLEQRKDEGEGHHAQDKDL